MAQSRESILSPEKDNAGFARWVESQKDLWLSIAGDLDIVIFGEWIGKGIQKNVACSSIPEKAFAIFAVRSLSDPDKFIAEPEALTAFNENALCKRTPNTHILPWFNDGILIDWSKSSEELTKDIEKINE